MTLLFFVAIAASGAVVRWFATERWPGGSRGTLTVNLTGAFLLGLLAGWTGPSLAVVGIGGLGSLTTFSGFIADAINLDGRSKHAGTFRYVAKTLILGIAAAWLGLTLSG